jgi:AcrR family transcriptional regulator
MAKQQATAPRRPRGRPRGETSRGREARARLYEVAVELIAERGYEATTLRAIAARAKVSPGLLYRYFPSKSAVVLELYDRLSTRYAESAELPKGAWVERFFAATQSSLDVLRPHRKTLKSLVPLLVGDPQRGLFAPQTARSRARVQGVFARAVLEAKNRPSGASAEALGRVLYLLHLAIILWWLLDKSPAQRATDGLLALLGTASPVAALALRLPPTRGLVVSADALFRDALFNEAPAEDEGSTPL